MSVFLLTLLKNIGGYIAGRLLKPEHAVEFLLDVADVVVARTDNDGDDEIVKSIRTALGHEED